MERLSDLLCFSEKTDDFLPPGVTGAAALQTVCGQAGLTQEFGMREQVQSAR